jgi:hypothetical protein
MMARKDRWPDLPHLDEPGCCPRCGEVLRPAASAVLAGGSWSKQGAWGGPETGGHLFVCTCPGCASRLLSFSDGWPRWEDMDACQVRWYPE